jgi:hypothetical protein
MVTPGVTAAADVHGGSLSRIHHPSWTYHRPQYHPSALGGIGTSCKATPNALIANSGSAFIIASPYPSRKLYVR